MPQPIWDIAADAVVQNVTHTIVLTEEMEHSLSAYIRDLPVRVVVDLFIVLESVGTTLTEAVHTTEMDDVDALTVTSAHGDHYTAILNQIRVILGNNSWLPADSAITAYTERYMHEMRQVEAMVGFTRETRENLLNIINMLILDADDEAEDDGDSVASSSSTATRETLVTVNDASLTLPDLLLSPEPDGGVSSGNWWSYRIMPWPMQRH